MTGAELNRSDLQVLAERLHGDFSTADPFPHVVIDDFLPGDVIRELIDAFPLPGPGWEHFDDPNQLKYTLRDEELIPPAIRSILRELNSQVFVEFLETLSGIKGLLPDPYFLGGGLHQIPRGGTLKVHADFDQHRKLRVDRRLNVLLYLNEDWDDAYGGHLELWDPTMTRRVKRVAPVANRLVIFRTSDTSFHGHPDALTVPKGRYRRSLAWYYYTAPSTDRIGHNTVWAKGDLSAGWRGKLRRLTAPGGVSAARSHISRGVPPSS